MYSLPTDFYMLHTHRERINKLLLVFADELKEVTEMTQGSIAAIVGLKNVC